MGVGGRRRRFGLGAKLNLMLITCILLISVGLVLTTYEVYCRKVDSFYIQQAQRAVSAASEDFTAYRYVQYLWQMIDTDEFREVRARAEAANDEGIIRDWMLEKPSVDIGVLSLPGETLPEGEETTLYGDYRFLADVLVRVKALFDITGVYIQYDVDGVTYNLVDPDESLLVVGSVEEPIAALAGYGENARIPPTVCRYGNDLLCVACEPIVDQWNGNAVLGYAGVDIDMNNVMRERRWFLVNSAVFIAVLTLAAIAVGVLLTRRLVTNPVRQLADGATRFAKGDEGCTMEDVIRLPIRSNDEIGDLYREIQSMQSRIVDYTGRLTRITAERERVKAELRMATQIQNAMLPSHFPAFPERRDFDLYASMTPAKEVGGDFYDFFLVDDDHLVLVIADVSDKGVPAALFMMSAKIIISYQAQMGGSPGGILASVNAQLFKNNESKMFVTAWLGVLELSTGRLTCANAAHEFPMIRGKDGAFRLYKDRHGLMLGAMKATQYQDYEVQLAPGDAVFVYTDGVSEASDPQGAFYGVERLEAALNRTGDVGPREILEAVRDDIAAFTDGAEKFDDLTMLCVVYGGKGN